MCDEHNEAQQIFKTGTHTCDVLEQYLTMCKAHLFVSKRSTYIVRARVHICVHIFNAVFKFSSSH